MSDEHAVTARDVLGVPVLPPSAVTAATNRIRSTIAALAEVMAPPPVRILEGVFGVLDHRVLVALCEVGVPDALDGPVTPAALAERVGADPEQLERLLRFAAAKRWVRMDRSGRVRPTRFTAFLRKDHRGGWGAWVEFAGGEEIVAAVGAVSARPGRSDGFAASNGSPFFAWMADHPQRWAVFDRAMAAGARMHALTLAGALDWPATPRICDVGGGTGALLAMLLELLPGATGTVFDLAPVVARAVVHPRLEAVAGDVFVAVPGGYDTYLLVNVLHDWSDAQAGAILARVAEAAGDRGRVVVVDADGAAVVRNVLSASADVLMAALTDGGRERDQNEFEQLGRGSGLRLARSHRLASGDRAYEFEPAPTR